MVIFKKLLVIINPQIRKSANPQIRKSANPQKIRKSANPQIRKSANPQIRKSANPQIAFKLFNHRFIKVINKNYFHKIFLAKYKSLNGFGNS